MSLSLDKSKDAEYLRYIARFCGVSTASAASGPIRVRLSKDNELYQLNTIAKYFAHQSNREKELCGSNAIERAEITMWMDFARGISNCPPSASFMHWKVLNNALMTKTYMVSNHMTLADAALYWELYPAIKEFTASDKQEYANLIRYFDQLQHSVGIRGFRDFQVFKLIGNESIALTC